jgi:hypothetical protein
MALPVEKQRTLGLWLVIFTVSPSDLGRIINLNRSHPMLVVCTKQRSSCSAHFGANSFLWSLSSEEPSGHRARVVRLRNSHSHRRPECNDGATDKQCTYECSIKQRAVQKEVLNQGQNVEIYFFLPGAPLWMIQALTPYECHHEEYKANHKHRSTR